MTEPTYQPGEIVDIVIRGARVVEDAGGRLTYAYTFAEHAVPSQSQIEHEADAVDVRRVMPAAGPPKVGELWEDADGRRYLAVPWGDEVRLNEGRGGGATAVSIVHGQWGPIKPVYRDPVDGAEDSRGGR